MRFGPTGGRGREETGRPWGGCESRPPNLLREWGPHVLAGLALVVFGYLLAILMFLLEVTE